MTFETLIRETLFEATRIVDRRREPSTAADRLRAIAEVAADLAVERCPRVAERMSRERLIELVLGEVGD